MTTTYRQPSRSMLPTLKLGQRVVVSLDPHYTPKVGDIVAFHPPAGAATGLPACHDPSEGLGHEKACAAPGPRPSNEIFLKRIVAKGGDTIKIVSGHVYRNGVQEDDAKYTLACGGGPSCDFPAEIAVPSGDYFLLGDNRAQSDDSRFWGPIPRAWIIGKAQ